ncbi:hypothetical protein MVG78_14910 [Roseomonas gilardii subsp. gilardii]|uniref:hypothetical protein n=1 Tax=Roseomonas gilardii TaxID=257708 RepID=UPI001FF9D0B6|nr:hypothetical protein [Roseomonas gilardii]UPG71820.1 hypothetical protein MVG78_14910 [Roseomonas gilardii subsp. gilardii]
MGWGDAGAPFRQPRPVPLASGEPLPLAPRHWQARDVLAVLLIALAGIAIAYGFGQLDELR